MLDPTMEEILRRDLWFARHRVVITEALPATILIWRPPGIFPSLFKAVESFAYGLFGSLAVMALLLIGIGQLVEESFEFPSWVLTVVSVVSLSMGGYFGVRRFKRARKRLTTEPIKGQVSKGQRGWFKVYGVPTGLLSRRVEFEAAFCPDEGQTYVDGRGNERAFSGNELLPGAHGLLGPGRLFAPYCESCRTLADECGHEVSESRE